MLDDMETIEASSVMEGMDPAVRKRTIELLHDAFFCAAAAGEGCERSGFEQWFRGLESFGGRDATRDVAKAAGFDGTAGWQTTSAYVSEFGIFCLMDFEFWRLV